MYLYKVVKRFTGGRDQNRTDNPTEVLATVFKAVCLP